MSHAPKSLERVIAPDAMSDVVSIATGILAIPPAPADGIVVFPGLGEWWRVRHAVTLWERGEGRALLIAGHNTRERTSMHLDIECLRTTFGLRRTTGVHIVLHEEHTGAQAEWVSSMVGRLALQRIALCVSAYHLPRAYCTILKALLRDGRRVPIIPRPTPAPFDCVIPETERPAWASIAGEVERIRRYQENGYVAPYEDLQEHLAWMWTQPPLVDLAVP